MTRLAVLFTEGYADWECAHLMAAGRAYFGFEVSVITPDGESVLSSGGVRVAPDGRLDTLDPATFDAFVVCGGTIWRTSAAPDIGVSVEQFRAAGKLVAGICDGVGALARTGILNQTVHTGNASEALNGLRGYGGQEHYVCSPRAVAGNGIVTAAGTAPVSFMAEVFRALGFGGSELDSYLGILAAEHQNL